jgi:hypothetical protein
VKIGIVIFMAKLRYSSVACVACVAASAVFDQAAPQTFTSNDGAFRFKCSPKLVRCTLQRAQNGGAGWVPADSCISQDELCDDEEIGATTIACFAYPKGKLKDKPRFDSATFCGPVAGGNDSKSLSRAVEELARPQR